MKHRKEARTNPVATEAESVSLSRRVQTKVEVAQIRLRRAQDVLSALAFCADQDAELSLGPVAIAARDLIDGVLDGLASLLPEKEDLE